MLTDEKILSIALKQSAIDSNCEPEDFLSGKNIAVVSAANAGARKYLELPFICDITSYGSGVVASCMPEIKDKVFEYINAYEGCHLFETPNLHVLRDILAPFDADICFMAEYFLPDMKKLKAIPCPYELRVLERADFENLYLDKWSNALCKKRRELDMLCVGAYENNELIALAGASADCDDMWQIGIDVLPSYRGKGVAKSLVSNLACEILKRNKVPFYCCAWSNIASLKTALASGFKPAWVCVTAKKNKYINEMNKKA